MKYVLLLVTKQYTSDVVQAKLSQVLDSREKELVVWFVSSSTLDIDKNLIMNHRLVNKGLISVATAAPAAAPKPEQKAAPVKVAPVVEAKKTVDESKKKKDDDELSMSAGSLTKYATCGCNAHSLFPLSRSPRHSRSPTPERTRSRRDSTRLV